MKKKELLIEITNKCPFNCIFCSSDSNIYKNKFINKSNFFKIISEAKKVGIKVIQLSGGEPFLHPDIKEFIDFILKKELLIEIYTCGNIYKDKKYLTIPEELLSNYKNNPNLTLRFNFQTIDEKRFIALTNNKYGLKNLITSIKICKKYKIKNEVHIVPNFLNIKQIELTIEFLLKELNITHIKILRLILHGRALQNSEKLIFDVNDLRNSISKIKKKYKKTEVEIGTAFSTLSNTCIDCQAGKNKFMITSDLKLFPCTAFKNETDCFIRINERNSLKKIISHKLIQRKIQKFYEKLGCNYCLKRESCYENCPIQKMICNKIMHTDITKPLIRMKVHL